jgi:hypothetical protein
MELLNSWFGVSPLVGPSQAIKKKKKTTPRWRRETSFAGNCGPGRIINKPLHGGFSSVSVATEDKDGRSSRVRRGSVFSGKVIGWVIHIAFANRWEMAFRDWGVQVSRMGPLCRRNTAVRTEFSSGKWTIMKCGCRTPPSTEQARAKPWKTDGHCVTKPLLLWGAMEVVPLGRWLGSMYSGETGEGVTRGLHSPKVGGACEQRHCMVLNLRVINETAPGMGLGQLDWCETEFSNDDPISMLLDKENLGSRSLSPCRIRF